ncbi:MAG: DUF3817 domain-containing protein [Saccharospirillaceae bacterium]|nr:DUF3817 domain-containing protein [Saccharospirillaceae bacterium]
MLKSNHPLSTLTQIGFLEGMSFLLLLGVAMPLKYMMGVNEAVRFAGSAHGIAVYGTSGEIPALGYACRGTGRDPAIWSVCVRLGDQKSRR